jgi:tetratricopeptide (TPR) repeat protein
VLEGSVRKSGDKVRITVQLVRASDGSHLWSETYDRTLDDVFKVQDEIAANVVDKLKLTLMSASPTARPVDPRVYPMLLQAKAIADQNSARNRKSAIALYKQIIAITPDEPRAWEGLARQYLNQVVNLELAAEEGIPLAREAIAKTLALDPSSGKAHGYLARLAADFEGDFPKAAREIAQAVALDPSGSAHGAACATLLTLSRLDDSLRWCRRAVELDPANSIPWGNLHFTLTLKGDCRAAIEAGRQTIALSADYPEAHYLIGQCQMRTGHPADALAELREEAVPQAQLAGLAIAYQKLGRRAEADAQRKLLETKYPVDGVYYLALVHAQQGNADAAFRALDQAAKQQDSGVTTMHSDWFLTPLHKDPRWLALLKRLGRAPEQLAKVEFTAVVPK